MTRFSLNTKLALAGNVGWFAAATALYFAFPRTPIAAAALKVADAVAITAGGVSLCAGLFSWVLLAHAVTREGAAWWALLIGAITALIPLLVGCMVLLGM